MCVMSGAAEAAGKTVKVNVGESICERQLSSSWKWTFGSTKKQAETETRNSPSCRSHS